MMSSNDDIQRTILPIPNIQPFGLTTYDAKDPDTKFPPIRDLRPPARRAQCACHLD
jgi:arylsulfatase